MVTLGHAPLDVGALGTHDAPLGDGDPVQRRVHLSVAAAAEAAAVGGAGLPHQTGTGRCRSSGGKLARER